MALEQRSTTPFTRSDLPELGLTPKRLELALKNGAVRRVVRGVYRFCEAPDTPELRAQAVALVAAPGQVVCDRTAAWIHGIDVFSWPEHEVLPRVEVCAMRGREPARRDGVHGHRRDLARDDVMEIAGMRVTTPLRTALDLGCFLRRRDALAALDQFARLYGLSRECLAREARRYRRRRGVVQLRELISLVNPLAESPRESWTRLAIHDADLPEPVAQHEVAGDGFNIRLDLAYPAHRIAVEYDGDEFHASSEQREHDERRRTWLREQGWTVIVIRNGDFTGVALDRWLARLRDAFNTAGYSTLRW